MRKHKHRKWSEERRARRDNFKSLTDLSFVLQGFASGIVVCLLLIAVAPWALGVITWYWEWVADFVWLHFGGTLIWTP